MQENTENKVKIRFKFRSGEEFEAEGSPAFIEKQRADFLTLIGKSGEASSPKHSTGFPHMSEHTQNTPLQPANAENVQTGGNGTNSDISRAPSAMLGNNVMPYPSPRNSVSAAGADAPSAAPRTSGQENLDIRLWEEITRPEENFFILRKKSRLLESDTAALLLIAAAKVLGGQSNGISALNLTKALHKSGYGGGRLDRILASEIKLGTIKASGSKRSRYYLLSDEGFARAYVVAGKLASEWN